MKKLLMIAITCLIAFSVNAQNGARSLISSNASALIPTVDTVTNTGVKTMALPATQIVKGPKQTTTVSAVITKISGTGAGTVVLKGSNDGVNFSTIASTQLQGGQTATFTLTDVASQAYHFVVLNNPFLYYETVTTGSGTEVISVKGTVLYN